MVGLLISSCSCDRDSSAMLAAAGWSGAFEASALVIGRELAPSPLVSGREPPMPDVTGLDPPEPIPEVTGRELVPWLDVSPREVEIMRVSC